jgi:hypothetical protein
METYAVAKSLRGVRMFCAAAELTSVERAMAHSHTASRGRRDLAAPVWARR